MTLIERIEAAEEGSRELSDDVLEACGWTLSKDAGPHRMYIPPDNSAPLHQEYAPCPTTSIDAALGLVPNNWYWGVELPGQFDAKELCEAWCWPRDSTFEPDWMNGQQGYRDAPEGKLGYAATPALALVAAALKARENEI